MSLGARLLRAGSLLLRRPIDNTVALSRAAQAENVSESVLLAWVQEEAEKRGHVLRLKDAVRLVQLARRSPRSRRLSGRLAVVTCHFNPAGWRNATDNYLRFLHEMRWWGVPVYAAEVAYEGQEFPTSDAFIQVKANKRNVLWQKERLLNLTVESLPACYDRVAWIDADVIFLDRHWVRRLESLLSQYPVVQLWNRWHCADESGAVGEVLTSVGPGGERYLAGGPISPGGAWAARRTVFPLYDKHIVGSGDAMALEGWLGLKHSRCMKRMNDPMREDFLPWAKDAWRKVRGQLGCLPGDTAHLFHGSRQDRKYVERWDPVIAAEFNPATHVQIGHNGLLEWTPSAPAELVRFVEHYFLQRREDGEGHAAI